MNLETTAPPANRDGPEDTRPPQDCVHALMPAAGAIASILETTRKRRTATSTAPEGWNKPRPCRWCRKKFSPKRPQDYKSRFCCPEHRQEFHQPHRMPNEKLMIQIEEKADREVERRMKIVNRRITELEKQLKKVLDSQGRQNVASNIEKSK